MNRILDWHINTRFPLREAIALMGIIPEFLLEDDPRPAHEQIAERYVGGWSPCGPDFGWSLLADDYLSYPGDRPLAPVATAFLREERIIIYPYAWTCIVQHDGAFSVARLD